MGLQLNEGGLRVLTLTSTEGVLRCRCLDFRILLLTSPGPGTPKIHLSVRRFALPLILPGGSDHFGATRGPHCLIIVRTPKSLLYISYTTVLGGQSPRTERRVENSSDGVLNYVV